MKIGFHIRTDTITVLKEGNYYFRYQSLVKRTAMKTNGDPSVFARCVIQLNRARHFD